MSEEHPLIEAIILKKKAQKSNADKLIIQKLEKRIAALAEMALDEGLKSHHDTEFNHEFLVSKTTNS